MPVIPTLRKLRHENCEFEVSLDHIESPYRSPHLPFTRPWSAFAMAEEGACLTLLVCPSGM